MARRTQTSCSFCGKPRDEGRRVIAGPGVFICADCVRLCSEILSTDTRPPSELTSNSDDQVEAKFVRRFTVGGRLRGLARRVRLWRVGGGPGKTPSVPSPQGGGTTG